MPHDRKRYAETRLIKALKYSPIVGIIGQRQVGKTTLLEQSSAEYLSFDKEKILQQAKMDPELFLQNRKFPFGIDEAQLCEELFPSLKEHVRVDKKMGQFLLSGSIRFTSKKSIRESLTGRIISIEVLPFSHSESESRPLPQTYKILVNAKKESDLCALEKNPTSSEKFDSFLLRGGLPGICFFRDAHIRADKFESHLDTLLNRDIRQVYPTTLFYSNLRALLEYLSKNQGRPFEYSEAIRVSQISAITLKKVLFAFEALFLIRKVDAQGERKGTFFLEDQGMATWLKNQTNKDSDDIIRGLYASMRHELHYQPEMNSKIFQWRTKNNVNVPLVLSSNLGVLGIIPTTDRIPSAKTLGNAQSFLKKFPSGKVVIAYNNENFVYKNSSMFWLPYWKLI